MPIVGDSFRYRLAADPRALAPMRHAMTSWLSDIHAGDAAGVVLAVGEAAANSIEHASLHFAQEIDISLSVTDQILHIEICDSGVWKPPSLSGSGDRGHGLELMRKIMDHVEVHYGKGGTRVVMRRDLH